jgi:two-component system chemotaxis response regulator CheB
MIRVLLVDDSASIRSILRKTITTQKDMMVCGTAADGQQALHAYKELKPDIVVMDFEMPKQNGVEALKQIISYDPNARVLMCSSFTHAGADVTLDALNEGAYDYVLKPSAELIGTLSGRFHESLVHKIRVGAAKRISTIVQGWVTASTENIILRKIPPAFHKADIIAIGSSTGGVQAILSLLGNFGSSKAGVPIVITQHMPKKFAQIFASHIEQKTHFKAVEAEEGMVLEKDCVYIAPCESHMEIGRRKTGQLHVHLSDAPPESYFKPSINPMFRSLAYMDANTLGIILTGMGNDGLNGAHVLVDEGHLLVAQDEASSVVWGMPGIVAVEGLCHAVLPLDEISGFVKRYL